uniref:CTP synthase n=1 Tax=Romanomermis culicivorax TaxID=13658 RepID=A0A915KDI7_ROMCU
MRQACLASSLLDPDLAEHLRAQLRACSPSVLVEQRSESTNSRAMKYILVTGGVISGVGKGVIASSLGLILKSKGIRVTAIKIDPYINIDAGTFSPYEHGEVYVLNDGAEVDLDLGNYERFMNVQLLQDNNITTGKIYASVIGEERQGVFLGKTVQVIPHITGAIQKWITRVASMPVDGTNLSPEVCIIELGGTVGDIEVMPFVEALSHFSVNVLKGRDFMNVHVSYLLEPKSTGEQKTKPTQASVRELRHLGLSPDLIVCRSDNVIREVALKKISQFCHIPVKHVIGVHDVPSIYEVPLLLNTPDVWDFIAEKFQLSKCHSPADLTNLQELLLRTRTATDSVRIVMVRKYVKIKDAYTSVIEALKHAALQCNKKLDLQRPRNQKLSALGAEAEQVTLASLLMTPPEFGKLNLSLELTRSSSRGASDAPNISHSVSESFIDSSHVVPPNHDKAGEIYQNGITEICENGVSHEAEIRKYEMIEKEADYTMEDHLEALNILASADGVLVPGGFGYRGIEGKIAVCKFCRENNIPFLGICLGMQCAVIEFARSILGLPAANSTEFDKNTDHPVVIEMPEHNPGQMGGTMRLGLRKTYFKHGPSRIRSLYEGQIKKDETGREFVEERHRHRYEVNPDYVSKLEENGLHFVSTDVECKRMEIIELRDHKYFVGVQYHPEYISRPLKPSPPYLGLLQAAICQRKLKNCV